MRICKGWKKSLEKNMLVFLEKMLMGPKRPADYKKQYQKLSQRAAERGAMPPWMIKDMQRMAG